MADLFEPLSLGTNIAKGYSLQDALEIVKYSGFEYVEIASIAGFCEHVTPAQIDSDYAVKVKKMLSDHGLKVHALAGHLDLTVESDLRDFLKKMEFAKGIGAKIVNTNSGPLQRMKEFKDAIKQIINLAEKLEIKVGLESHGDIIGTAKTAIAIFKEINHPLIRFNYDTGNTYYHSKGKVCIQEDIKYGLPYIEHIHLKDLVIQGDRAQYCPIGEGDIDFKEVFKVIKSLRKPVACGLEIPVFARGNLVALSSEDAPISRAAIASAVESSMKNINSILTDL
ncbi:MAG: hypothetical protein APF77_12290 [Clostridia bacterium BRH_c25]|nr:MAG: hypothetical protein APF77_12290 [Clostridia bacterium BRH_c25]